MHNVCAGEPNYYVKGNGVCARVRKSGAIIVLGSGSDRDVTVANGAGDGKWLKLGTYKDMVGGGAHRQCFYNLWSCWRVRYCCHL